MARIHTLARRMTGPDEADEVTQDVFVRAWQKLETFRGESAFGTWLYRVAINVALARRQRLGTHRARHTSDESALDNVAVPPRQSEVGIDFERAIGRLPEGARQVFVLHDVEGYEHEEIARQLGCSVGTSKSQLHKARMKLRMLLRQQKEAYMNAHEQWIERLSDYADGEISPSDRSELESHLASCDECARALEEIRGVITTAHGLEDRAPETDLWPAIEARLESGRILGRSSRWFGRRFHVSFPQLAAAALALVLLSAGGMWVALHGHSIGLFRLPDRFSEPSTLTGRPTPGGTAGSALAAIDFASYDQAVAELERVLRENRERLDPSTLQVVEKNLAIIDRATEDARLALARDPGNPYLGGYLADQMKRKIRVLKQATDLLNTQS